MLPNHIGQHRSQRGGVGNEANRRLTRQSQRSIAKTPSEMDIPKHGPVPGAVRTWLGCARLTAGPLCSRVHTLAPRAKMYPYLRSRHERGHIFD